jgi:hypothetical protein
MQGRESVKDPLSDGGRPEGLVAFDSSNGLFKTREWAADVLPVLALALDKSNGT